MAEPSTRTTTKVVSKDIDPKCVSSVTSFLSNVGVFSSLPDEYRTKDFYSNLVGSHLKVHKIERGSLTVHLSVKPAISNFYGGIDGGAVAAIGERVAIACARTVVAEGKEIFLGELSISYLSAAPTNADLIVDASIVRSGKNVSVVAIEFKLKKSGKLACMVRATFYNTPVSKL